VQEAEELAARNLWREAIALLAAENRIEANTDLERCMVDLRLGACKYLNFESSEISQPQVGDRAAPDWILEAGIPVIQAGQLNPVTLCKALTEHGHLIVRGLLPTEAMQSSRDAIDQALAARVSTYAEGETPANRAWYYESPQFPGNHVSYSRRDAAKKFTLTGSIPVMDSPRAAFNLLELYQQAGIPELLEGYFGEEALIATRKWMLRLVTPRSDVDDGIGGGWHQDGQFMGEEIRTINLWLPLSHCGDGTAAPGIALIPKRLHEVVEYGTRGAKLDWTVGAELAAEIAEDAPMVRPHFEPGDALFFDHLSLHRTGHAAHQTENRYAIESWFYAASAHGDRPVMPTF
jgi:hypothetical protein